MTLHVARRPRVPRWLLSLAWVGFAFLLFTGISASALRATHPSDLYRVMEPLREAVLSAFGVSEPNAPRRAAAVAQIDDKYAKHAVATLVHVGSGALLFVLLPLQFSKFIRSPFRAVHRWSGRLLVVVAWITGLAGLFFGVLHPFAGAFERLIIGLVGTWFLVSISVATSEFGGVTRRSIANGCSARPQAHSASRWCGLPYFRSMSH